MASIAVNYGFGYAIGHAHLTSKHKATRILTVAVTVNIGLLAYFKYANFFIANLGKLTGTELSTVNIVLPLGISFSHSRRSPFSWMYIAVLLASTTSSTTCYL